jgi:hypothetical protein
VKPCQPFSGTRQTFHILSALPAAKLIKEAFSIISSPDVQLRGKSRKSKKSHLIGTSTRYEVVFRVSVKESKHSLRAS